LILALPGTFLSFSRGGYLAMFVIGLLLALTHRLRIWLAAGIVVVALALSRIPPVASRISHELNPTDPNNSLQERYRLWAATLRMLRDHPILGAGLSGFQQTVDRYRNGSYTEQLIYPHNILLNFWSETGLLGLAAFAWIFGQGVRTAWQG